MEANTFWLIVIFIPLVFLVFYIWFVTKERNEFQDLAIEKDHELRTLQAQYCPDEVTGSMNINVFMDKLKWFVNMLPINDDQRTGFVSNGLILLLVSIRDLDKITKEQGRLESQVVFHGCIWKLMTEFRDIDLIAQYADDRIILAMPGTWFGDVDDEPVDSDAEIYDVAEDMGYKIKDDILSTVMYRGSRLGLQDVNVGAAYYRHRDGMDKLIVRAESALFLAESCPESVMVYNPATEYEMRRSQIKLAVVNDDPE